MKRSASKTDKRRFHSVRLTYTLLFGVIVALILLGLWGMSRAFLPRTYFSYEMRQVKAARSSVEALMTDKSLTEDERTTAFEQLSDRYHLSVLVLESNNVPRYSTFANPGVLTRHLNEYILRGDESPYITVFENSENGVLCQVDDPATERSYLEYMGFIPGETHYPYMIAYPMEAIEESAAFLSRFIVAIGLVGLLLGMIAVYAATRGITRPILRLTEISEHMRNLEFHIRYDGKEKNEIGELGRNMNRLSGQLQETITDLKTANAALREEYLAKTQEEERRKGFLSDVSHELKTPIALIRGYAEGLKDLGDDPEARAEYCDVIMDEAEKMDRLVRQITELNSLEEGRSAQMERFELTFFLKEVMRSFEPAFAERQATPVLECGGPVFVWGDALLTEEVLDNYLSNAAHYVSEGGQVRVSVQESGTPEAPTVRIGVMNTGDGIPEESIGRVWEKFYKADKARSRAYGGSGIGLSIVRAIQENLGKAYGVQNVPGGVEFWFEMERG